MWWEMDTSLFSSEITMLLALLEGPPGSIEGPEALLVKQVVGAVRVTVRTPSVQVTRGGSVVLPCSFRSTAALTRLNIIWTVTPLQEPRHPLQVIAYEQGRVLEGLSEYLGRVSFTSAPTQDATIIINHTRVSDTGTYQCAVLNPPDGATPNIGLVGLTVMVPPSSPDCASEGSGHEGGKIRLRCSVMEGIPAPRFQWEKISPDGQLLITSQEDYRGTTTLTNITSGTSGLYRCTATNLLGSRACAIQIHLHNGGMSPLAVLAAVGVTLVMGLVLLALCGLVMFLHRQSRGSWLKAELSPDARLGSAEPLPVLRSPCSRVSCPLWMPPLPAGHIVYIVRHSQLSLPPVPETPSVQSPLSTESSSSLYSINSGFLV